ncbi:MAG: hypothetical protein V3T08_05475 [Gemmatimonadota bacterium]
MRPTTEFGELHKRTTQPLCLFAALALLAGCQIPSAPQWEVGVLVPFELDRITLGDYLPAEVLDTTIGGQPAFAVQSQQDSIRSSLGQMCPACVVFNGLSQPVPAFDYTDSLDVPWPIGITSVGVTSSTLIFRLRNDMGFDPLRPNPDPASAGFIALVGRDLSTGALLDSMLVSGVSDSFPPGTTREIALTLANIEISEGVRTLISVHSPFDGQIATIDTALAVGLTTVIDDIVLFGVTTVIDSDTLDESFALAIDQDIRTQVATDVLGGTIELEIVHNIDVAGLLTVSVAGSPADLFSGSAINELQLFTLDFAPAPTGRLTTRNVTRQELQFIANLPQIHIGYRGVASGASTDPLGRPIARLTPGQFVEARIRLTARIAVDPNPSPDPTAP